MGDWNLEPVEAKSKRRGIIEQRQVQYCKRKKISKPWTVYKLRVFSSELFGGDGSRRMSERKFATEDQAIRYAEKERRGYPYPLRGGRAREHYVWVADNGERQ